MSVTLPHVQGMTTTTSASPYLSTAGVVWGTGSSGNALTSNEAEELRQLEIELSLAKRNQRITIFKSLPTDIRQSVVNQLILDDALSQMRTCDGEGFESNTRLAHLKSRATPSLGYSGISATSPFGYHQPNTSTIIEFLTKEEAINAHLEQCIEESLLNTSTDLI